MNMLELMIAYRNNSIRRILGALSKNLIEIEKMTDPEHPEDAIEEWEDFLGIAFITTQLYITGIVSDLNKYSKGSQSLNKWELLKNFSKTIPETEVTEMELCDAMANYFKHHDEWKWFDWSSPTPAQKRTVEKLQSVGIDDQEHYPCIEAVGILMPTNSLALQQPYFQPLASMMIEWGEKVISVSKI